MSNIRIFLLMFGLMLVAWTFSGCTTKQTDSTSLRLDNITWLRSANSYGHTCIKIQTDEQVIYLDPVDLVDIEDLPPADIILITHHHTDHFSPETINTLSNERTTILSCDSPEITKLFGGENAIAITPGQKASVGGLEVEGIPAYGSSYHPPELRGIGFSFTINGVRIYCSGDTGLTPEIESLSNVDIAVLNVRKPYALSGEDVIEFAKIVKPGIIIPIHWMPENNIYSDQEEIEFIQQNIPNTTRFSVLDHP